MEIVLPRIYGCSRAVNRVSDLFFFVERALQIQGYGIFPSILHQIELKAVQIDKID